MFNFLVNDTAEMFIHRSAEQLRKVFTAAIILSSASALSPNAFVHLWFTDAGYCCLSLHCAADKAKQEPPL